MLFGKPPGWPVKYAHSSARSVPTMARTSSPTLMDARSRGTPVHPLPVLLYISGGISARDVRPLPPADPMLVWKDLNQLPAHWFFGHRPNRSAAASAVYFAARACSWPVG